MSRKDADLFDSLLDSILQLKKGLPRPGSDLLEKAEKETYEKLTTSVHEPTTSVFTTRVDLEREILSTVNDVFRGETFSPLDFEDLVKSFFPSVSANYINSRKEQGAYGEIVNNAELMDWVQTNSTLINFEHEGYTDMHGKFHEVMGVNKDILETKFTSLYTALLNTAVNEVPVAVPQALAEPLKTRVITKGPPYLYTVLKPLQRFMWRCLQKFPCFSLTGQPVSEEIVNTMFQYDPSGVFLSIDYSDATNDLFSWCSELVLNAMYSLGIIDSLYLDMSRKAMTQHFIEMKDDLASRRPQKRGQLMGSILSFPILCLINFSVCKLASKLDGKLISLSSGVLINGDDGVLQGSKNLYDYWTSVCTLVGWRPSVGKVYQSSNFFNINSRSFNLRSNRFIITPYVNMGIIKGKKRSEILSNSKEGSYKLIGALARELIASCPEQLRERCLCQFIHRHKSYLLTLPIPWFLPEFVGGVGLPEMEGKYNAQHNHYDLARANIIFKEKLRVPHFSPISWNFFEYAQSKLPKYTNVLNLPDTKSVEEFKNPGLVLSLNQLRSLYSIESIFANRLKSDLGHGRNPVYRIFRPMDKFSLKKTEKKYYTSCRNLWKRATQALKPDSFRSQNLFDLSTLPPMSIGKSNVYPVVQKQKLSFTPLRPLSLTSSFDDTYDDLILHFG